MENIGQRLKQKSAKANKSEYFVFLPNNLTDISTINANPVDPVFQRAIAAKNEGNLNFEKERYDDAIRDYDRAITIFEEMDSELCATALSVCYQNRATAKACKKNCISAISDVSKAIKLNEHYSKAYYRRAMCYKDQKKFYLALQDIMQACVLERFKNLHYISAAIKIVAEIDKHAPTSQWKFAYAEMDIASMSCDDCTKQQMEFVQKCGIFDAISVPIPENQPVKTGFMRAMAGINDLNKDEIMAGCDEEISSKGKFLAQSYILMTYMKSVVIQSPKTIDEDVRQGIQRMNAIILDATIPEKIKHQAIFCRANLYNRRYEFFEACRDLDSLEDQYGSTGLFHVIKSCALYQMALENEDFHESLEKCAEVLPDLYEIHFQAMYAKAKAIQNSSKKFFFMISSLERLIKRFPLELPPRMFLITLYIEMDDTRTATRLLEQTKKDFPERLEDFISLYGRLRPKNPSCVDHFKRGIRAHKDDPNSFTGLLEYFSSTSHEYAKAIEVSTKALASFLKIDDFQEMFEHRQQLIKKIIRQKFWDKL